MSQERLSSLSVLSIENGFAKDIDFEEVINSFASVKARKRIFRFESIFVQNIRTL